ncbi:ATP-binding cassette domain-containing protein [Vitreoscilla massiliensis]
MFIDNVITQSIVFEGNGVLKEYIGGYQDYQDAKARELSLQAAKVETSSSNDKKVISRDKSQRTVKLSYKEQRELEQLPQILADLEQEQSQLNEFLLLPDVFKDQYQQAIDAQQRINEIEESLLEQLERWEYLENKQNGLLPS